MNIVNSIKSEDWVKAKEEIRSALSNRVTEAIGLVAKGVNKQISNKKKQHLLKLNKIMKQWMQLNKELQDEPQENPHDMTGLSGNTNEY